MNNTCYSGGAIGSDLLWDIAAKGVGHDVIHLVFPKHKAEKYPDSKVLSHDLLIEADPYIDKANTILKRDIKGISYFVKNLFRRTYFVVLSVDKLYAVTTINEEAIPAGGTAWGIIMAIQMGMKEIYVFDQSYNQWFKQNYIKKSDDELVLVPSWNSIKKPPRPEGKYAGIGTRDPNINGKLAIERLYE